MPEAKILYLHGFRSSPDSFKARLMAQAMADRPADWACPQLPASPKAAAELARELAQNLLGDAPPRNLTVVGSSLGGYYATWLAQVLDCKAVLINPAVNAPRDLATQVGEHKMYHSAAPFVFLPDYVQELHELHVPVLTHPERYFLIAATGDEVLDWREMRERFAGCRQRIIPGSDHGVSDFAQWLPEVLDFALTGPH
ncbi:YqiA/YcfP family alpha/beta fold hydrolase [Bordetella avium]|uniref:Esterase n=1 Tax=Bordetella avium (strain 197N) TaxID=360910 RepID=Q2KUU7_BORA1|nr:YqiA/YcfP family alpha/beta fold hydrolase [Bordetella avium]AZY50348.1 esterase [Bordetella avium]AZY54423.1 esterase [Bordetella avium]RIQ15484.1 alpha/beta fold hydrolase [Bordetella avium]RIQ19709.1 alpha/beta fold hydrolase [Bordetella avium]RIQ34711.1 alpha/beta fold hydrolase [Bordetella avium]